MRRVNLYPTPSTPLVNDGSTDVGWGTFDGKANLAAGKYFISFDSTPKTDGQTDENVGVVKADWSGILDGSGHVEKSFTLDKAQTITIRPNKPGVEVANIIIEDMATHDIASGGGLPGSFTKDTAPY